MKRRAVPLAIAAAFAVILGIAAFVPRAPTLSGEPSIRLLRGGPYRFALEAPGGGRAELVPDGRPPVALSTDPMRPTRVVLEPGVARLRVTAAPGARLLWHPPGRVSDVTLEYVPRSAVGAGTPGDARSPLDALLAFALLALLIALALWLARERLRAAGRPVIIATLAVLALAAAVRLIDLDGAGQTWDEDVNWSAGRNYVQNVLSLDASPRSWVWNYEHPPVSKYLAGIGALWEDGYVAARAIMAAVMALGCALLVPIGARLFSPRAGVLAGVVAALTPHLIAHGKVVGHEAPTVLWWSLALLLCLGAHDPDERGVDDRATTRRLQLRLVAIGVVLGLAVATRFVNALLAAPIAVTLVALAPAELRRRTVAWGALILPLAALATIMILWPRLWTSPIAHLAESWARLRKPHGAEPFLGAMTNQPPPSYFVVYLLATAPAGLLVLVVAGVARLGRGVFLRDARARRAALVIAIWIAAPLGVMASPVRQDGVRYVMPCLVMLALLAGGGLDTLASAAATRARAAAIAVIAAAAIYLGVVAARIHPYYLDYYGELVGGPAGVAAARRFETAWWGEGLGDAVGYVNAHAGRGARLHRDCIGPAHLAWFRADLWDGMVRDPKQAEWIVVYAPRTQSCPVPTDARLAHTVEAMGAPLVWVYQREVAGAPAPGQAPSP